MLVVTAHLPVERKSVATHYD